MQIPIIMPQLGESIAEATIVSFLVKPGEHVEADQDIIEVETNKANMNVASPCRGRIEKFVALLNESYPVGAVLGQIEATQEEAARSSTRCRPNCQRHRATSRREIISRPPTAKNVASSQPFAACLCRLTQRARVTCHRAWARMDELGLPPTCPASRARRGCRVTIQDFEKYIAHLENQNSPRPDHARGRGRRDAPQLDAPAGHGRAAGYLTPCSRIASANPKPGLAPTPCARHCAGRNSASAGRLVGNKIVHPSSIDVGRVEAEDGARAGDPQRDKKPPGDLVTRYDELIELARQRKLLGDARRFDRHRHQPSGTFGLTGPRRPARADPCARSAPAAKCRDGTRPASISRRPSRRPLTLSSTIAY